MHSSWFVYKYFAQTLHVAIWYILRAQRGSHRTTLGPKYISCSYMQPLGSGTNYIRLLHFLGFRGWGFGG